MKGSEMIIPLLRQASSKGGVETARIKLNYVETSELSRSATAYLTNHPELIAFASVVNSRYSGRGNKIAAAAASTPMLRDAKDMDLDELMQQMHLRPDLKAQLEAAFRHIRIGTSQLD